MADENILSKIKKLLALSKSDNQFEAELAAQRASDLMQAHQIAFADVELADARDTGAVDVDERLGDSVAVTRWLITLANGCGKLFDCQVVNVSGCNRARKVSPTGRGTVVTWIGTPKDVAMAREIFNYLYDAWQGIVKADAKNQRDAWGAMDANEARKFRREHGIGFAYAIYDRAARAARDRKAAVRNASGTGTALVVLKDQLVTQHMAATFPRLSNARRVSVNSYSAGFRAGHTAGSNVAFGRRIEQ